MAHDILFSASKTKLMFIFIKTSQYFDKYVQFMGSSICFVDKSKFIRLSIFRDIQSAINTFNRNGNGIRLYYISPF